MRFSCSIHVEANGICQLFYTLNRIVGRVAQSRWTGGGGGEGNVGGTQNMTSSVIGLFRVSSSGVFNVNTLLLLGDAV